ncbi:MAG: CvpA family protein [Ruminococcaceae bacterium]|nr:CvpA family protein [Oscillospiraceae bacterium]
MNKFLKGFIKTLVILAVVFLEYWFLLPPINLRSTAFYFFIAVVTVTAFVIGRIGNLFSAAKTVKEVNVNNVKTLSIGNFKGLKLSTKTTVIICLLLAVLVLVGNIIGAKIFNASKYNTLITFNDGDFVKEVSEIGMDQIPVVDRDTASRLGQRKLGEMSDLVSQFEIEEIYTQINYKGRPVRVTPLRYGDVIKWLNNRKQGIPAYITVDMASQDTALIRLDNGIKYSKSEYFMRNVERKLRFDYPTKIFDDISFEIDDNGTPYWVASTVEFRIGLFSGRDIGGAVLMNAVTGESKYYTLSEIPSWVDQVFSSAMVLNQLDYNGKYRSGWLNSIIGQKGVIATTDGYNYLAINDDVWLYTGITSVTSDESNIGFVLTNLRTKETKYYPLPGAEEYSAMSSAQGQVQHLGYKATFPILLNVAERPSYFMSLKDSAGLVKMYAFVDVQQYQIVGTGNTVEESRIDYLNKLKKNDVTLSEEKNENISGTVLEIGSAVMDGNTCYFVTLEGNDKVFILPVTLSDRLPFLKTGDVITVHFNQSEVTKVEFN